MGVGRLVMTPERDAAEFAVIVADPWQGKGLGQKLIERVIEIARENGVNLFGVMSWPQTCPCWSW